MGNLEKVFISLLGTAYFGLMFALLAWLNVFSTIEGQWKLVLNVVILGAMLVAAVGAVIVVRLSAERKSGDNT